MISLLSSILFTNIIYLISGKLFTKKSIVNFKDFAEISINGFIYISFLALLINFFISLNVTINSLIFFFICLIYLLKKKSFEKRELITLVILSLFCFLIILFDTVNRPDAALYHLPFTRILNEEKIIFGLTNLHFRYGHVSIIQYSSAINKNYLFGDIGILIPLISIYGLLIFYFIGDISNFLFKKEGQNSNHLSIIFSCLVIIYVAYKINRYSEFGNDAIGHLIFFYLISKLINLNKFDNINFNKVYLLSVFAILNKFTLIFSIFIPIFIFFKNKISFRKAFLSIPTIFLCLWILRNIVTSGCAFYPQINLCFTDLKWSNKEEIILQSLSAEAWSKDWPNRKQKDITMKEYIKDFNWLSSWKDNHFKKVKKILVPYMITLFLIYIYFKIKINKKIRINFSSYIFNLALFVSFVGTLVFFLKFPIYRYGYSYLIIFLILISINSFKFYNLKKLKKLSISVLFIFLISFIYKQLDRYIKFYEVRNPIPQIYNTEKKFKSIKFSKNDYYNYTLNTNCMYDVNLCTRGPIEKLIIKNKYSYKFFEVTK